MTTSAKSAFGTTIQWNAEAIGEVLSISGPSQSVDTIDVTSHDSSDSFREFIAGLRDGGEVTIEGNFIPGNTGQADLHTDMQAGTVREVIITFPSAMGTTFTFDALCTAHETTAPHDEKAGFSATFKVTGKPVLATATATAPTDVVVTGNVSGALSEVPTYSADDTIYTVDGSADASVTITVTAAGADEITVNGGTVESGVASSAISLTSGEITTITIVVSETNKADYTITIYVMDGTA